MEGITAWEFDPTWELQSACSSKTWYSFSRMISFKYQIMKKLISFNWIK
jgi:hypothetical protein